MRLFFTCLLILTFPGLLPAETDDRHRKRAEATARNVLDEKAADGPGLGELPVEGSSQARFYDPTNPDAPPRPQDDPASHEIMEQVDGKRGAASWRDDAILSSVEAKEWREHLPLNEEGKVILDLENAVRLALTHSRSYQSEREDLFLAALDVTGQRFRFQNQFALTNRSDRTGIGSRRAGEDDGSNFLSDTNASFTRRTATGGEFVAGLANSILWDISGDSETLLSSVVNFGVVQPILRSRAREFVLEDLTQSERSLLANVRRMEQFQQGFYVDVVAGRNIVSGPTRGSAGIEVAPLIASLGGTNGFFGLLQDIQEIRNQESSVAALWDSLAQLQAAFDAGRTSNRLQVDQARQAFYNSQSILLNANASFEGSLDNYKVSTLGLPPELDVAISDELLNQFNLVDPVISRLQARVAQILGGVRSRSTLQSPEDFDNYLQRVLNLEQPIDRQIGRARADLESLRQSIPARRQQLLELRARPELQNEYVDPQLFDVEVLDGLADQLEQDVSKLEQKMIDVQDNMAALREVPPPPQQLERARSHVISELSTLGSDLLELSLIQAKARLESVTLEDVEIEFEGALELAREHRMDWMNARAALVDAWRQIAVDADALKNGLNLIIQGDVPTTDNDALNFTSDAGRLQVGLEIDTPLRRLNERNAYRETLIDYQRARRAYMLYEDRVKQSLRNTLRTVRLSQLNFEVRRAAVRVAISQVDLARFRLNEPPRPGAGGAQFGATTARDLVSALGDLLDAQNDFLNVWVSYEVLRVLLDFELGTMRLTDGGIWQDPGEMTEESLQQGLAEDQRVINLEQTEPVPEEAPVSEVTTAEPPKKKGIFSIFRKN